MGEKPFKDREEAKNQLITCGNWCNICEGFCLPTCRNRNHLESIED
jgi:hypothetical protein